MRVCQFRHFGTVVHVANPAAGHGSRESSVFQTRGALSIARLFAYTGTAQSSTYAGRHICPLMNDKIQTAPQPGTTEIPEEVALEIRKLSHDLSNALEIIVQTNYLLGTVEMKDPGKEWLHMLEGGVRKALDINLALRNYIKAHSPH